MVDEAIANQQYRVNEESLFTIMATGGEILIDCLLALGSKSVWYSGESHLAVLDAIYDKREDFISFM